MATFDEFLMAREAASTAFVEGDVGPLLALSVTSDPATIFPPTGSLVSGAEAVNGGNEKGATAFAPPAENRFEILHSGSDGALGYWTGIQHSKLTMKDADEPVAMTLRVTELFRKVDGEWQLFHRHADRMATE